MLFVVYRTFIICYGILLFIFDIRNSLLERPTLASRVLLFLLGHFQTNECEISKFCL